MRGVIDVLFQRINRLPRRHVDEDSVIIIRPEIGGVTCRGLKPPDKAGAGVSQGIDFIQPGDKSFHHGIFEWALIRPILTWAMWYAVTGFPLPNSPAANRFVIHEISSDIVEDLFWSACDELALSIHPLCRTG